MRIYGGPCAYRTAPVDAFEKHGKLGGREMDRALGGLRPDEAATLQALGKEAQAVTIPPQQFDEIATPATEDEDVTTEGISAQPLLGDSCQTIEAPAHVGHPGGEPDARSRRQADHRGRRVVSTVCRTSRSTRPLREMRARPSSMSIRPGGDSSTDDRAGSSGMTVTGRSDGALSATVVLAMGNCRRHLCSWLALMPWAIATPAIDAPGCRLASTALCLNSRLWVLRVAISCPLKLSGHQQASA